MVCVSISSFTANPCFSQKLYYLVGQHSDLSDIACVLAVLVVIIFYLLIISI